jgi:transcriptional regulator with XRE-family HTH domain
LRKAKLSQGGMALKLRPAQSDGMNPPNNLRALRRRAGLRQPVIAERMDVSIPQISRWESGKDDIPGRRLPAMAEAYRSTVGEIYGPTELFEPVGPTLYVKGEVAAGVWLDAYEWPQDDWQTFTGRADVTVDIDARFGLRVVGESMNLLYPHGSLIECVKLLAGAELSPGKRVVVLRERDDGEVEATVKEYVVDAEGIEWLWPRSNHPEFQQPWRTDQIQPGIVRIEVIGVVVASVRPE